MSTNNSQAMLVDTTSAISSTNSPALVVPIPESGLSFVAPGGKWYMVYVPPGGTLPIVPVPLIPGDTTTTPPTSSVSVQEATSSTESQPNSTPPAASMPDSQLANKPPRYNKRGRGAGKSRRRWYEAMTAAKRLSETTPPRPNHIPAYQPSMQQLECPCTLCRFAAAKGYPPRYFCFNGCH